MRLTKLYIGSNNETGILELDKIVEGFGYYDGIIEQTAIIEIYGFYNQGIIPELKLQLKQKSILVAESIAESIADANYND